MCSCGDDKAFCENPNCVFGDCHDPPGPIFTTPIPSNPNHRLSVGYLPYYLSQRKDQNCFFTPDWLDPALYTNLMVAWGGVDVTTWEATDGGSNIKGWWQKSIRRKTANPNLKVSVSLEISDKSLYLFDV